MRILFRFLSVLIVLVTFHQLIGYASADGYSNYVTNPISYEEQESFFSELKYFETVSQNTEQHPISCFALSDSGLVALGFDTSDDAIIYVYNATGQFLYGYRFLNNHCAFTVFFEGEDLSIYWGKSRYIGSFDSEGNCIQLRKVVNCSQNSDAYYADKYRPAKGKVGNVEYHAERGIGLSTKYTRFVLKDPNGETHVIYDITRVQKHHMIIYTILILLFAAIVSGILIKTHKEHKYD